jgi:hypothetical protein
MIAGLVIVGSVALTRRYRYDVGTSREVVEPSPGLVVVER